MIGRTMLRAGPGYQRRPCWLERQPPGNPFRSRPLL